MSSLTNIKELEIEHDKGIKIHSLLKLQKHQTILTAHLQKNVRLI